MPGDRIVDRAARRPPRPTPTARPDDGSARRGCAGSAHPIPRSRECRLDHRDGRACPGRARRGPRRDTRRWPRSPRSRRARPPLDRGRGSSRGSPPEPHRSRRRGADRRAAGRARAPSTRASRSRRAAPRPARAASPRRRRGPSSTSMARTRRPARVVSTTWVRRSVGIRRTRRGAAGAGWSDVAGHSGARVHRPLSSPDYARPVLTRASATPEPMVRYGDTNGLLQVVLELSAPGRVAQLAQRLRLDLADPHCGTCSTSRSRRVSCSIAVRGIGFLRRLPPPPEPGSSRKP